MNNTAFIREFSSPTKSENVGHWLRHVDIVATGNRWEEAQKCAFAAAALKGPAAFWLDSVNFTSWSEFSDGWKARFLESPDKLLKKLMSCKQGKSEGVEHFIDNYKMLLTSCAESGNALPAAMQLKFFLDGLKPELRLKIKDRRPHTLNEAISDCKYFEEEWSQEEASTVVQHHRSAPEQNPSNSWQPPHARNKPGLQHANNQHRPNPQRNDRYNAASQRQVDDLSRQLEELTLIMSRQQPPPPRNDRAGHAPSVPRIQSAEMYMPDVAQEYGYPGVSASAPSHDRSQYPEAFASAAPRGRSAYSKSFSSFSWSILRRLPTQMAERASCGL